MESPAANRDQSCVLRHTLVHHVLNISSPSLFYKLPFASTSQPTTFTLSRSCKLTTYKTCLPRHSHGNAAPSMRDPMNCRETSPTVFCAEGRIACGFGATNKYPFIYHSRDIGDTLYRASRSCLPFVLTHLHVNV